MTILYLELSTIPDIFYKKCTCIYIYNRTHVIRILRGPGNLFELHDYSNYRSFHT